MLTFAPFAQQQAATPAENNFQISGIVVNATRGEALPRTKVTIAATSGRSSVHTMTTNGDGRFLFANLAPGKYSLSAERQGFYSQTYQQHEAYSTAIAVGAGKQSDDIVFPLNPESSISGRVIDEQNEPVRNSQVLLYEKSVEDGVLKNRNRGRGGSNDLGVYRFGHLKPGTYFVAVVAKPWYAMYGNSQSSNPPSSDGTTPLDVAYPVTYYQGTQDADSALPITLHPGDSSVADFSLTVAPALHLRVSRQGSGFFPVAIPTLVPRVFGSSQGVNGSMQMSSSGSGSGPMIEEVVGVAPGQYNLLTHTSTPGGSTQLSTRTATFSKDGFLDLEDYTPVVHVSGVVRFEGAAAPERASIEFREAVSGIATPNPLSNKNEFERIPMKPGTYQILMSNNGGFNITGIAALGAKVSGRSIEIPSTGPVQLTISASRGIAQIDGIAQHGDNPASGVMIVLVPQDPANNTPLFRRDQSDSDGTFSLANVLPGNYTALAIENRWDLEWANSYALAPYMEKGESIKVEAGAKLSLKLNTQ